MDKAIHVLALIAILLAATLCPDLTNADSLQRPASRLKRQAKASPEEEGSGEAEHGSGEPEAESKGGGVSLGKILGLVFWPAASFTVLVSVGKSTKCAKVLTSKKSLYSSSTSEVLNKHYLNTIG